MASYAYTAINAAGLELRGEVQASTASAAREQLRVQGLLAEELEEVGSGGASAQKSVDRPPWRLEERERKVKAASSRSSRGSSRP